MNFFQEKQKVYQLFKFLTDHLTNTTNVKINTTFLFISLTASSSKITERYQKCYKTSVCIIVDYSNDCYNETNLK